MTELEREAEAGPSEDAGEIRPLHQEKERYGPGRCLQTSEGLTWAQGVGSAGPEGQKWATLVVFWLSLLYKTNPKLTASNTKSPPA